MGGTGSGRYGGRPVVDGCRSLDINKLHREGCLRPGWSGSWRWARDGEIVGSITLWSEPDRLHLAYRMRTVGGQWEDVDEAIRVVRVLCRFGGSRPYFICPGVVNGVACGRRVAKLYTAGRYFLCRPCYGLAYQSQREQAYERALRRANNIRMRLGGDPGMLSPFPEKPKGMHWRTYEQLRLGVREAEAVAEERLVVNLERLKASVGKGQRASGFWT